MEVDRGSVAEPDPRVRMGRPVAGENSLHRLVREPELRQNRLGAADVGPRDEQVDVDIGSCCRFAVEPPRDRRPPQEDRVDPRGLQPRHDFGRHRVGVEADPGGQQPGG
jgi:hypothetical protein